MKTHPFSGTGVAVVTPFNNSGDVDYPALTKVVEHLISGGVDYLVAMGTTGESVVLSKEEKDLVVDHILKINNKRCPVVLGIGGNNTSAVLAQISSQNFSGISGILSVSPYYNKPTQAGIYAHYQSIANACPVPVILYNVPGRTGSMITPETTLKLARDFKNIVATKEASGNIEAIMEIIRKKPDGFEVISGDDGIALPLIALGAKGVISVLANAFPTKMSSIIRLSLEGDFESARKIQYEILELIKYIFLDGNPAGIKAVMAHLGIINEFVRLPLVAVGSDTKKRLQELCDELLKAL